MEDYVHKINNDHKMGVMDLYSFKKLLGVGGTGKVYLVERDGIEYAMKIPTGIQLDDGDTIVGTKDNETIQKFMHEAENWARISDRCPDSAVVLSDYNTDPFPWMVMELANDNFRQHIDSGKATPSEIADLLDSLQNIHDVGVIHRDIKPENILNISGSWKFSDFGLSKMMGNKSNTTQMMGTPTYMAPEQLTRKFGPTDTNTDQWQMAIILYEVLTGHSPYDSDDMAEIGMSILMEEINLSDIPSNFKPIISKALSKKKDQRYHSVHEFADAIRKCNVGRSVEQTSNNEQIIPEGKDFTRIAVNPDTTITLLNESLNVHIISLVSERFIINSMDIDQTNSNDIKIRGCKEIIVDPRDVREINLDPTIYFYRTSLKSNPQYLITVEYNDKKCKTLIDGNFNASTNFERFISDFDKCFKRVPIETRISDKDKPFRKIANNNIKYGFGQADPNLSISLFEGNVTLKADDFDISNPSKCIRNGEINVILNPAYIRCFRLKPEIYAKSGFFAKKFRIIVVEYKDKEYNLPLVNDSKAQKLYYEFLNVFETAYPSFT